MSKIMEKQYEDTLRENSRLLTEVKKLQAELAEYKTLKELCHKVVRLNNQTGKGLPCVTSKSDVQCWDIFSAVRNIEQALEGE